MADRGAEVPPTSTDKNGPQFVCFCGENHPTASCIYDPSAERESPRHPEFMDNPPAVGAPKGWKWGYLPCGCRNDGFGRHLQ